MKLYPRLTAQEHRERAAKLREASELLPDLRYRADGIARLHEMLARRNEERERKNPPTESFPRS
jgi:hypothetical protein